MSNFDFINDLSESSTIKNSDYTMVDIFDHNTGSYNTNKITFLDFTLQIKSYLGVNSTFNFNSLEQKIETIQIALSSKLHKNGIFFNIDEKISGPFVLNSTLSVFENSHFDKYINLNYNLIKNLSVHSPVNSYDLINKKYVDYFIIQVFNSIINPFNFVSKSNSVMTGLLSLHADPEDPYHISTKNYADSLFSNLSNYVVLNGTNFITDYLSAIEPTNNSHIVTKKYFDKNNNSKDFLLTTGGILNGHIFIPTLIDNINEGNNIFIANRDYVIYSNNNTISKYLSTGGGYIKNQIEVLTPNVSSEISNKYYADLNINHDKFVLLSGNMMTGFLSSLHPISHVDIVNKQYVDNIFDIINNKYAKLDENINITDGLYVLSDPTFNTQIATLRYAILRNNTNSYIKTTGDSLSVINQNSGKLFVQPLYYEVNDEYLIANKKYIDDAYKIIKNSLVKTGGTLTNPISVLQPNTNTEITNKQYVDYIASLRDVFVNKDNPINLIGKLIIENQPNQNPEIANKKYVDNLDLNYVYLSGYSTLTDRLYIDTTPTSRIQILTKNAVDFAYILLSKLALKNSSFTIKNPLYIDYPIDSNPSILIPKYYIDNLLSESKNFLKVTGGLLTGDFFVLNAISANHIVNKKNVDDRFSFNLKIPLSGNIKLENTLSAFSDPINVKQVSTKRYADNIVNVNNYTKLTNSYLKKTSFKRTSQSYIELDSSSTLTLDSNLGNVYQINIISSINNFIIKNINTTKAYYFTFFLKQKTNTGSINWIINNQRVLWSNQIRPILSNTIDAIDVVSIVYINGVYFGFDGGQQF